jgi:DUF1009 family protein
MSAPATAPEPLGPLGVIAGAGRMPVRLADAAAKQGRGAFCVLVEGFAEPSDYARFPHEVVRLGAVGRMLSLLRGAGARQLVIAGRVKRPSLRGLGLDGEGLRLLARVGQRVLLGGDDRLLSTILAELRREGFDPLGPQEILGELLVPEGVLTRRAPEAADLDDIARGVRVALALGAQDVGQAVVVQQGLVLGVEAIEGTDALLARCAELRREGPGGVLVKLVKPSQDHRIDLPTIGPETVRGAAAAGLAGIAIQAASGSAGTLVVERDATISAADAAGLFLAAIRPETHLTEEKPR